MSVAQNVGERSTQIFYEKFLLGKYDWAPKDTTLNEQNLPAFKIAGQLEEFKPMLRAISEDGDLRMKADRLHNLVHAPDTQEYLERYHPHENMSKIELAHDLSGTTELFSDWSQSYEKRQNKVKFNGLIHTQMAFGTDV